MKRFGLFLLFFLLVALFSRADSIHYYVGVGETLQTSDGVSSPPIYDPGPFYVNLDPYGPRWHHHHEVQEAAAVTPEPGTLLYFASGVFSLAYYMKKRILR